MTIYEFIGGICEDLEYNSTTGVNYLYGSWKSISTFLQDSIRNGEAVSGRYPLVIFVTEDLTQSVEVDPTLNTEYPLHIVIVNLTNPNYRDSQRLENNFKTILIPIYDALIKALRPYSKNDYSELPHQRKDHFYYSTDDNKTNNKLAEFLDAIEITGLSILKNFNESNCDNF